MPWPVSIRGLLFEAAQFAGFKYVDNLPILIQAVADTAQDVQDATGMIGGYAPGETTLASAATVNVGGTNTLRVAITGTAVITGFGTIANRLRFIRFTGAATLTHSANLILPGAANIVTAAGDTAIAISEVVGIWRVAHYQSADGLPVTNLGGSFRNRLRNSNFTVNQRAVSNSVTLAAGQYGHDGFKAGSGGCTYTFAKASGVTTITITAGTLQQIIEGALYLTEGGQYTLSWLGTAQGRVNGSASAASPITVAGLTAEANATVEWGTGTLALPMFEPGPKRTPFESRDDELRRCQRYFQSAYAPGVAPGTPNAAAAFNGTSNGTSYSIINVVTFFTPLRAVPTVVFYSTKTGATGKVHKGANTTDYDGYTQTLTREFMAVALFNASTANGDYISVVYTASAEL